MSTVNTKPTESEPGDYQQAYEENRISWNAATVQHNRHKGDQAAFLRQGGSTLYPEEIALLGDIRGLELLHLQCNAGQDTLSIAAHLGATVTGVDLSDEAVRFARQLSLESGIPATFQQANIYDWFAGNSRQYDVVFSSYGALVWLGDLAGWGRGVAAALKPGGRVVLVEFHPMLSTLFGALAGDWAEGDDYMGGGHIVYETGVDDYVAEALGALPNSATAMEESAFVNPNPCHEFSWGLADVVTVLLDAGLQLTALHEYPHSNGFRPFQQLIPMPGGRWAFPETMPVIPLMYGVSAIK